MSKSIVIVYTDCGLSQEQCGHLACVRAVVCVCVLVLLYVRGPNVLARIER